MVELLFVLLLFVLVWGWPILGAIVGGILGRSRGTKGIVIGLVLGGACSAACAYLVVPALNKSAGMF